MNDNWRPRLSPPTGNQRGWAQGIGMAMSFGAILVVSLWITWKFGSWLDGLFGTAPYLTLAAMAVGIISSFRMFIRELDKEQKKREEARHDE